MTAIADAPRPPDPRQPRQPDGRGRCAPGVRRAAAAPPCPPAPRPASTRPSSCATAARPSAARACCGAVEHVNGEIADAVRGRDAADQAGLDRALIELDGTDDQGPARRQRDPRRVARGRPRARRRARACRSGARSRAARAPLLPTPMMNVLNGGAHADNPVDFQEFMIMPVGADLVRAGAADGRRDLPAAQVRSCARAGSRPASATRAASPRRSTSNEAPLELLIAAIEAAGYRPGEDIAIALDPAAQRVLRRRRLPAGGRGPHADLRARWSTTGRRCSTATRSSRSRTAWPRTTGRAGRR